VALFYADCVRRAWLKQLETVSVMSSQRIGDVSYRNANSVIFPGICDNIDPSFIISYAGLAAARENCIRNGHILQLRDGNTRLQI